MKMIDTIRRAARSLGNAKVRTALTALAIGVGAFTLTVTLAAGNGIRDYTDRLVANNFDPAELIVGKDPEVENTGAPNTAPREFDEDLGSISFGPGAGGSLQIEQVTDEDIERLEQYDFVDDVRPSYQVNANYITRPDQKRYTLTIESYNPGQRPEVTAGSLPSTGDIEKGTALLPEAYVSLLGFQGSEDAIGKEVTVVASQPFSQEALSDYFNDLQLGQLQPGATPPEPETTELTVRVAAVTRQSPTSLAFGGLPVYLSEADTSGLYDFTTEGTDSFGRYVYAFVRVKGENKEAAATAAKAALKADGYYVQTSQDIQQTITQFVDILQILVGVFGVITVIASVFGIVNTMYISVLERTREIGLMKALGMRSVDIGWLFRVEAAWIGFLGGVLGSVIAFAVGTVLNPWLTQQLNLGDGNTILIFDIVQILILIAILTIVAILAGWLPARKAAKLDPIEALRTE